MTNLRGLAPWVLSNKTNYISAGVPERYLHFQYFKLVKSSDKSLHTLAPCSIK